MEKRTKYVVGGLAALGLAYSVNFAYHTIKLSNIENEMTGMIKNLESIRRNILTAEKNCENPDLSQGLRALSYDMVNELWEVAEVAEEKMKDYEDESIEHERKRWTVF